MLIPTELRTVLWRLEDIHRDLWLRDPDWVREKLLPWLEWLEQELSAPALSWTEESQSNALPILSEAEKNFHHQIPSGAMRPRFRPWQRM